MSGAQTIASTYTAGLFLTGTQTNTFVFTSDATIANTAKTALSGHGAYNWSIQNAGLIQVVSGKAGSGAIVLGTASIANAASGRIAGYTAGIYVAGTGTVSNQGTVSSGQTAGNAYSYNTDNRTATVLSAAIMLGSGSVTNAGSGLISGALGGIGTNGAGSIANDGNIEGGQFGVFLDGGGTVVNTSGGTIYGGQYAVYGGIRGALTVVNEGYIASTAGLGVELFGGGTVSNGSSGTITGAQYAIRTDNAPSTVFNAGQLYGATRAGVALMDGGQVSNATTGIVYGYLAGLAAFGAEATTVANAGRMAGAGFGFVAYSANAQVLNSGTIASQQSGWLTDFPGSGVALQAGGSVTNASGGLILARGIGVQIGTQSVSAAGTLINQGYIFSGGGDFGAAVWVNGPSLISNSSTGKIEGGPYGVVVYDATTLINSGYIVGTNFAFDAMKSGVRQRVIVHPGARFVGTVYGGNPIGSAVVSTLELASGTAAGTLSGIGTQFLGFGQIAVDSGANWTLSGANTILSGATLAVGGTLTNTGFEAGGAELDGGTLVNAAGATIVDSFAAVYGPGGGTGGTVVNAGVLTGPASGSGAGVVLFSGGSVTNSATGLISGAEAVYIDGAGTAANGGTAINAGRIVGYLAQGVELDAGGSVTNAIGGTIAGAATAIIVRFQNAASQSATVVNRGLIAGGTGYGIQLTSAGKDMLINAANGIIVGGRGGAYAAAGATVSNAGSIGSNGIGTTALRFGTGSDNRLVLYPGATFGGIVDGGNTLGASAVSTLELAPAASAGAFTGLGSVYIDFGQIVVDPGATWSIVGNATLAAGQTLANLGTLNDTGLRLNGGNLTNTVGGTIVGTSFAAVRGAGLGGATVINFGVIEPAAYSVYLPEGGLVSNAAGASIKGYRIGIEIEGVAGSVVNSGAIVGVSGNTYGVDLAAGGSIVNAADGTIAGGSAGAVIGGATGTVENAGTIVGGLLAGIVLNAGGLLTNLSGGTIAGYGGFARGIGAYNTAATVINAGSISSAGRYGVFLDDGGSVTNLGGATIAGYNGGIAIQHAIGTVTNSGLIASPNGTAVYISDGRIANLSTGTIGGVTGIFADGGTTIVDAGTIVGNTDAIVFGGTGQHLLILQRGYVLQGGIAGFDAGDTIEIDDIAATDTSYADGILTLVAASGTLSIGLTGNFGPSQIEVKNIGGDVQIGIAPAAPIITGAMAQQTTTDLASISPFSQIAIVDPNPDRTETATVTLSNAANGSLNDSGGGSFDSATGIYVVAGTAAAIARALDALVFTPTEHQIEPGLAVTTTFVVQVTDTAGATATDSTTTVIATAIASPLAIAGGPTGQRTGDTAGVAPLSNAIIIDPNFGQTETVTVTLSAAANGILTNLGIGGYNATTGVYSVIGTAAMVATALDALIFIPSAHQVAPGRSVTTTFAIEVADTAGARATDTATTVIATAVAGPIAIVGAVADRKTDDATAFAPFSNIIIVDSNFGQTDRVTVTLSAAANGTLTNLGIGSYNAATGVYTAVGSAAAVTAALNALVFAPTAHQVAPGGTVTTTFAIEDIDTVGLGAIDRTTMVIATAVAVPIAIVGTAAGQKTNDTRPLTPFLNVIVVDPNFGQTETVTVALSSTANGILTNLGIGSYNTSTGVYTVAGTAAAVSAALETLVFVPTAHQVAVGQTVTTAFAIEATDTASIRISDSIATVLTTAMAGHPTIAGTAAGQTTIDLAAVSPFSNVTISDPNANQTQTATIVLSAATNGIFNNPGRGSYNATLGIYTVSGTAAVVTAAIDGLIFVPTAHRVASGQASVTIFTITISDTIGAAISDSATTVVATGTTSIEDLGVARLVQIGAQYYMLNSTGIGPALQFGGVPVISGQYGAWAPIGAEPSIGGYEVAWRNGTGIAAQYIVWHTDSRGNYVSDSTGVLASTDLSLEILEPSFQQDLNGDGTIGAPTVAIEAYGATTLASRTTTIHLGTDTASASDGLSAPSLAFIGIPNAIVLGTGASIVEYTLQASSGIATLANFVLGTDLLNIDLLGVATSALRTYDTTVDGVHAIAIASSGDATHGVVLLNMTAGETASDLLAYRTLFSNGHALIG